MAQAKSQIGVLALQALKAVEGDATPDSSDVTLIEAAYDQVYASLRSRNLASWGSAGEVPDEAVNSVVALVAEARIGFFKPPQDAAADIRLKASTAFEDLVEVLQPDYVSQPVPAEYF